MNILFTCAGRRNYLINYFKEALNGEGKVFATDMQMTAPAMVDADKGFIVPSIYEESYIDALMSIIKKNDVKAVISLNDLELPILARNKAVLEAKGVKLIVSGDKVIDIAFDKMKTVDFLRSIGLKTPRTYTSLEEVKAALSNNELCFPLVIKPRWGSASIGIDFPETLEELDLAFQLQKIKLKKTILSEASKSDLDNAILIQEKLLGKEYGMDVLNDFEENYIGTFVREKVSMRSGETDKAISVINDKITLIGKTIGANLKHIGNLDCDLFEHEGDFYVLELNPRFGGGYPFSHESGINTAKIYIEWLKGNKEIAEYNNYKENVFFSKCDRLININ